MKSFKELFTEYYKTPTNTPPYHAGKYADNPNLRSQVHTTPYWSDASTEKGFEGTTLDIPMDVDHRKSKPKHRSGLKFKDHKVSYVPVSTLRPIELMKSGSTINMDAYSRDKVHKMVVALHRGDQLPPIRVGYVKDTTFGPNSKYYTESILDGHHRALAYQMAFGPHAKVPVIKINHKDIETDA